MSIERFEPPRKRQSLLRRALSVLSREKKAPLPNNWEIYNADKSRRYCFYEWKNEEEVFRQLNVQLDYKIGRSWGTIMKAMTRWEKQEEQAFAVEVEALTSRTDICEMAHYLYEMSTGGHKSMYGMWSRPLGIPDDEARRVVRSLGFLNEADLPEYVDFERTITQFMLQAERLDYSTPVLIPKYLVR